MRGPVGGGKAVQSIIDDDGHYSDIHGVIPRHRASVRSRSSGYDHYHYIDIDRVNADNGEGDQPAADPSGGDPSVLATLHQPQRSQDSAGLAKGEAAEEVEMTGVGPQNAVSRRS